MNGLAEGSPGNQVPASESASLTKEERDGMTPSHVIEELKKGNQRFRGDTPPAGVKGAIDDVVMGNLTGLLARVKAALAATEFEGEKSSTNGTYVDAVAWTNVGLVLVEIRRRSPILAELEEQERIRMTGAMYDLTTGVVEFID